MSAFLSSVKADLLDVRLRLAVVILALGLVAAVVYAAIGGSSSATPPTAHAQVSTGAVGIAVTQAPSSAGQAVAETTNGSSQQQGPTRDPFTPLPETSAASASAAKTSGSTAAGSTTTSSTTTGATSGSSSSGGGTTTTSPSKSPTPAKPTPPAVVYHVAVLFGLAPPGTPPQSLQLTPYENLSRLTALPSSEQPLLVFRGVTAGGKSATFTLISEAILHGPATCIPSASQCQAIELKVGQAEELGYVSSTGEAVTYQLHVVSISSSKASAAKAAAAFDAESRVGRELLRRTGLTALPGMRYSPQRGVLVSQGAFAHTAHARAARRRRHGR